MSGYGELRREMLKRLKRSLAELGFKQGSRDSKERHYRQSGDARLAIECDIDARYDISIMTRYHIGFAPASRIFLRSHNEHCRRLVVPKTLDATYDESNISYLTIFTCLQERLLGIDDWTHDEITDESEFEDLYERTLWNIKTYGLPYFEKYGTPEAVLRVIETDSDEWRYLQNLRGQFLVAGAAMICAYRNRDALRDYLSRHEADPDFCGDYRKQAEIMLEIATTASLK